MDNRHAGVRTTSRTRCHENGRAGKGYGPSRYPNHTSSAARHAPTDALATTGVIPAPGIACTRYGTALPTVSAPTMVPTASPRRARNQVAIIFMAGGYTPASARPVMKRQSSAPDSCSDCNSMALAAAPTSAHAANSARAGTMSATLSTAEMAVPVTKPSCTIVVSHAASLLLSVHCAVYCADTALAANHSVIPSSSATVRRPSMRQRSGCESLAGGTSAGSPVGALLIRGAPPTLRWTRQTRRHAPPGRAGYAPRWRRAHATLRKNERRDCPRDRTR